MTKDENGSTNSGRSLELKIVGIGVTEVSLPRQCLQEFNTSREHGQGRGGFGATDSNDESLKDELLQLRRDRDAITIALEEANRLKPPTGTDELADGQESIEIVLEFPEGKRDSFYPFWDDIIRSVLPQTLGAGADNQAISLALISLAKAGGSGIYSANISPFDWESALVAVSSLGKIVNQMVALGLIEGQASSTETIWRATAYGAKEGCRRVAVLKRRVNAANTADDG